MMIPYRQVALIVQNVARYSFACKRPLLNSRCNFGVKKGRLTNWNGSKKKLRKDLNDNLIAVYSAQMCLADAVY